jgi:biopolymer transport protein ExbD
MLPIILAVSVAMVGLEVLLAIRLLLDGQGRRSGTARLAVVLAVLAPLLTGILAVVGIHLRRIAPFLPMPFASVESVKEILGPPSPEPLEELGGPALFGGLGLLVLALSGLLLLLAVRTQRRRAGQPAAGGVLACLGASLLSGMGGFALLWTQLAGSELLRAWEGAGMDKAPAMAEALPAALQPAWLPLASWCLTGLLTLAGVWIAARHLRKTRLETSGLLACIVVLAMGAGAFAFTRGHAEDATRGLETMLDPRAGPEYDSALFGLLERGMLLPDPVKLADGVKLPVSNTRVEHRWAVSVALAMDRLEVEGNKLIELEGGRFPDSALEPETHRIETLFRLLSKFRDIEKQQGTDPASNQISLQADGRLPYATIFTTLRTAAQAGLPFARVVVRTDQQELPGRLRVGIINVSLPTVSEASSTGIGLVRLGANEETPGPSRTIATVQIQSDRIVATHSRSGDITPDPVAKGVFEGAFDQRLRGLAAWVEDLKKHYPKSESVVLVPDENVPWQEVIACLDATREKVIDPRLDTRLLLLTNAVLTREIR